MSPIDRHALEDRMKVQGLEPKAWSYPPGLRLAEQSFEYDVVVVVVEGSITYGLTGYGVGIMLNPGERMDMPAGSPHDAVAGPKGGSYLEAHLPPGSVGHKTRGRGYRW